LSTDGKLIAQINAAHATLDILVSSLNPDDKPIAQDFSQASLASRSKEYAFSAVVLRETTSGQVLHTLTGHSADVVAVAFSPDSRRLATVSGDRTVKLWDTATGRDVLTLRGHTAGVLCLSFSPDGNLIATGSYDNTARIWNGTPLPAEVIADHDARYQRKLTTLGQLNDASDDLQRGEALALGGHWAMAVSVLGSLVERKPDDLQRRSTHLLWLLMAGDEDGYRRGAEKVADVLDRTDRRGQNDPQQRSYRGLSHLIADDLSGYRREVQKLRDRLVAATDWNVTAWNLAWDCALGPDALTDWAGPVRLVRQADERALGSAAMRNMLGAILFRAGRHAEAVMALEESIRSNGLGGNAFDWLFMAMARDRLGQTDQAREALAKALDWIAHGDERALPDPYIPAPLLWYTKLELSVLAHEAETRVLGHLAPAATIVPKPAKAMPTIADPGPKESRHGDR
jgi:tetratricopeptide (TPR) repeat protein